MKTISIKMLTSPEDLTLVKNLESLVWADEDSVPVNHSIAVVKNGGMVIGAFIDDQLIGFQYSFPGFDGTNVYLCSHSMGIHPDFRKMGIGEKLKLKQRDEALKKGYKLIVWTYDPLETVNGYLNLSKLGGVCTQYIENCYGNMQDILNAGMPSDRFLVEWRITEEPVSGHLEMDENGDGPILINVAIDEQGFPVPESVDLNYGNDANVLYVPVPSHIQAIKTDRMVAALEWRLKTREVFSHYLNKGWIVTELRKSQKPYLYYYILQKRD
ncbi:GNAT family N-acetyltransferase [Bacillus salipaludis]|uniref:GNAT family N-acetyltransferase n=1 Tax=Bacillus salipaludis TaxID=2547811 RepID=A0ABW8RNE4_9BACI